MRISPLFMGFMYLLIGIMFTYLAIQNADNGLWNISTILLMVVATLDFVVAIRSFYLHLILKNKKSM